MSGGTWRALILNAALLTWVGLLAIGASGVVTGAMSAAFGPEFVAGDLPGVTYTPERCAEFQSATPPGTTCAKAAALHHNDEVVGYRVDAGVLGIIVFIGWWIARRRSPAGAGALPPGLVSGAGTAMFGVVGLGLAVLGTSMLPIGSGAGAYLSAGLVSLIVALVFAARLYSELRDWRPSVTSSKGN
jgi:hypothetical protein